MRAAAVPLLMLLLVGCGDDSGTGGGGDDRRTITVSATDALKFDPATITAKAGEQVTFEVRNTGTTDHEFVIGDADYQAGHGTGDGHDHGDGQGAAVDVPAGKTVRLDFTMPPGAPVYACHVNDHDKAGMTGSVRYG